MSVSPILKLPPLLFLLLLLLPLPILLAQNDNILPQSTDPISSITGTFSPDTDPIADASVKATNNIKHANHHRTAPEFVNAHNAIRSTIGERPLSWDRKLARHARRWSEQRRGDCALTHSGNKEYGENMFWGAGFEWLAADAVKYWADEHLYYDPVNNACESNKMCGHFTQMVWNNTVKIGCGRAECYDGGVIIACNYYPPGNYVGEKPFEMIGGQQ